MSAGNKRKRSDAAISGLDQSKPPSRTASAACTACRKQKIRCDMPNEQPPCLRCERRGLSCVLHSAIRVNGVTAKEMNLLRNDVLNIHAVLGHVCESLALEPPRGIISLQQPHDEQRDQQQAEAPGSEVGEEEFCELSPPASPSNVHAPIDTILGNAKVEPSPAGSSPNVVRRKTLEDCDLISKRLVAPETAKKLVKRYLSRLDPFLYGIASHHKDLEGIRKASPTLLAAVCAVSALHDEKDRETFEICNKEFRTLVSSSLFEKRDAEHIRALCIGSFWMMNASRILCSDAIRRAADVRLYRHFYRLSTLDASSTAEECTGHRDLIRLWYLLFVSDQHQAILHNRDPLIRQEQNFSEQMDWFLTSGGTTSQDARIISQVSLLHIMNQIRDAFGADLMKRLPKSSSIQFNHFTRELDQWYSRYSAIFRSYADLGDFPAAGLNMHCQFAKLYLGHHVFRGLKDEPVPTHFLTAAASAYETATNVFTMVLENDAFRNNLTGMPQYFHIMISFAGHFLLEVCAKHRDQLGMSLEVDLKRIRAVLAHFAQNKALPQHSITQVTTGLMRQLSGFASTLGIESELSDSPFMSLDFLSTVGLDLSNGLVEGQSGAKTPSDLQLNQGSSNLQTFPDFPDFAFQDLEFDFHH